MICKAKTESGGKIVQLSLWKTVLNILGSGTLRLMNGMARVSRSGLMAAAMMVTGNMTKLMDEADSYMQMVMFTKGIGSVIKLMVMVFILI